MKIDADV